MMTDTAPAAAPVGTPAPEAPGSLFAGITPPVDPASLPPEPTPPATPAPGDWMPEKFRVLGADGALDEAASARKLADSYRALEAHKGAMPNVPATPADYTFALPKDAEGKEIEGFDAAAFAADPLFQSYAKDAHALGMTQEQLQFNVERYLTAAGRLLEADQGLSLTEARAELETVWHDKATFDRNIGASLAAIKGFGGEADEIPGSRARLEAKFGRDPDFIAFSAAVGAEMKEDRAIVASGGTGQVDIEALQRSAAYWDPNHADHARIKGQVETFYAKKHGTKKR